MANDLPTPATNPERFAAKAAGMDIKTPTPVTSMEKYLDAIAKGNSIENLKDVVIEDPENGEVLKYDAEQDKWVNGTASGGGGTSDYTDLTNKPKINNVTLAGNKSLSDIGAADASETYTETEVDALLAEKADADDVYTKTEVDTELTKKVDKVPGKGLSTNDFTNTDKANLATALEKANAAAPQSTTYTRAEVDTALAAKLNTADVDAAISSTSTNPVQNKTVQAPIARLVDAGAKNFMKSEAQSKTDGGVEFTVNSDGTYTLNGTATVSTWFVLSTGNTIKAGSYVLTSGVEDLGRDVIVAIAPSMSINDAIMRSDTIPTATFTTDQAGMLFAIRVQNGASFSNVVVKPMLCTAEDYAISQQFVQYAPSNRELFEMILALQNAQNGG